MQVTTATVVGGKIVVEGVPLVEGTVVTVLSREPDEPKYAAWRRCRVRGQASSAGRESRFGVSSAPPALRQQQHPSMRVAHRTVVSGKVVLDEPALPEVADVYVLSHEPGEPVHLSPAELAELEAGLAEADRSDTTTGQELFERLRHHG